MNTAAKVRAAKEAHPERFCSDTKCLWRTVTAQGPKPCPRHPVAVRTPEEFRAVLESANAAEVRRTRCDNCGEPATKLVSSSDAMGGNPAFGSCRSFRCDGCTDALVAELIARGLTWAVQPLRKPDDDEIAALETAGKVIDLMGALKQSIR